MIYNVLDKFQVNIIKRQFLFLKSNIHEVTIDDCYSIN